MKKNPLKAITLTLAGVFALAIGSMTGCKDNKIDLLTTTPTAGTEVIDATIGGYPPSTYTTPGAWKVDKTHSNINWDTKYYATGAILNGKFNTFDIQVKFDEANPSNTKIYAWVLLSSYNTGEVGRDAYGKCGPGYLGVKYDTVSTGPVVLAPRASTDTAWFRSTSCERYGSGYLVKGDFTFNGVTRNIEMPMAYAPKATATNATTGKKTDRAGLSGNFNINAKTVFGVTSGSIDDIVNINVNCNMVTLAY